MKPPKIIARVEPLAPNVVVRRHGAVATIDAVVGADGHVRFACVTSGDHDWGKAVTDAVLKWTFEPATRDGKPITSIFHMTSKLRV